MKSIHNEEKKQDVSYAAVQKTTTALIKLIKSQANVEDRAGFREGHTHYTDFINSFYGSILPDLLATGVSFTDFKIEDALGFLNDNLSGLPESITWVHKKQCELLWRSIVSFGITSGASVQEVADKMAIIYARYPNLADYQLEYESAIDSQPTRIQKNVSIYFKELLLEFIAPYEKFHKPREDFWHPEYHVSDQHIIASLKKNPELFRVVRLADTQARDIGYQFIDSDHLYEHAHGETLLARIALRRDESSTLFRELLGIMKSECNEQTIKYLVTLPAYKAAFFYEFAS